jgi:hypothetical protein
VRGKSGVHGVTNDQIPSPKSQSKSNDQAQNPKPKAKIAAELAPFWELVIGTWDLIGIWNLGAWDFSQSNSPPNMSRAHGVSPS